MPSTMTRHRIDWQQLYREGQRVTLAGELLGEASVFVAPFDDARDVVVVLLPTPRHYVGMARAALLRWAEMIRGGQGLLGMMRLITGR